MSDDSAEGALNNLLLVRTMLQPIDQGYILGAPSHEDLDFMCFCVGHLIQHSATEITASPCVVEMKPANAEGTALKCSVDALCSLAQDHLHAV